MDEAEEIEEYEMREGDYYLFPSGSLGSRMEVCQYSKCLGSFVEYTDMERFIRERMESENFWPNVWSVSDHGNVSRYTMDREG